MEAARFWGLTPHEYADRSEMEQAVMLTHWREQRLRKAHVDKVQSDVSEKESSASKPNSGPSAHDHFFSG